jgi:D-alanyl-D-alanine carboxypeptidase
VPLLRVDMMRPRRRRSAPSPTGSPGRTVAVILLVGALVVGWGTQAYGKGTRAAAVATSDAQLPSGQRARLVAAVRRGFREASVPGAVVGVQTRKGRWIKAIGIGNESTKVPMRAPVHQRIGSVTKTFVGALLMQLAGEGKLSLDDKVSKYVAGVPNGDLITLRQLADMTSGIASYTANPDFVNVLFSDPYRVWQAPELLPFGFSNSPVFAPGTAFQYSDSNYVLLGLVIQEATGRPFRAVLRKRILKPLELTQTSFPGRSAVLPKPHARGYTLQGQPSGQPGDATNYNPSYAFTAGEMISTVRDLLVYARATGTGKGLLTRRLQKQRLASFNLIPPLTRQLSYGIGLVYDMGWIGHTGQVPGYTTALYYHRPSDTAVVIEANSDISSGNCPGQPTLIDDPFDGLCALPADRIMKTVAASLGHTYMLPPG